MQNQKVFNELEGIYKWITQKKQEKNQQMSSYYQIKEFFNFLNLDASNEEIEALHELVNPNQNPQIDYESLYNIFVPNSESNQSEKKDLYNAFKCFSDNETDIELVNLEKILMLYDKKYKQSIESVINDMKQTDSFRNGKFYFKEYLDHHFIQKS